MKKSGTTKAKKVERQKAFYTSPAWRKLKKAAKERAGHRCEYRYRKEDHLFALGHHLIPAWDGRCGQTEGLHVHHTTNVRFGGGELPEDLQVLCEDHHRLVEQRDHPTRAKHY